MKAGVVTGAVATNPATGASIPVFVADYVLMGYGTGAIMGCPARTSGTGSSRKRSTCRSSVRFSLRKVSRGGPTQEAVRQSTPASSMG